VGVPGAAIRGGLLVLLRTLVLWCKTLHLHLTSTVEYALNNVDAEAVVVLGMRQAHGLFQAGVVRQSVTALHVLCLTRLRQRLNAVD
jgi:hypothetical protein